MLNPLLRDVLHRLLLGVPVKELASPQVPLIAETLTLRELIPILQKERRGAVLVKNDLGEVTGIISERDLIKKVALGASDRLEQAAAGIMTRNPETIKGSASVARALYTLAAGGFRHLPVADAHGRITNLISVNDLLDFLHKTLTRKLVTKSISVEELHQRHQEVEQFFAGGVLALNPIAPVAIFPHRSIADCIECLKEKNIGSVLILNTAKRLIGIFTERDYLLKVSLKEEELTQQPISLVMTPKPQTITEATTVAFAMNLISEQGFRHLPVVDGYEQLIGVLSARDLVDTLAAAILGDLQKK